MNRAPAFWAADGVVPRLLAPVAAVVGSIAARRLRRPPRATATVPVIAVGNFTAGGAGKTPTVAALIDLLEAAGHRPAVLSRGFGGRLTGPVVVEPGRHGATDVGDEPLLHAALAPTVVARDRAAGAALAVATGADVLLLDDGFQNRSLARDFALVVVDRAQGIGNGRVLPAGPLRAPLAAQMAAADALVLIEAGEVASPSLAAVRRAADARRLPVFGARLVPRAPEGLCGHRVVAFAGIGRPEKFAATLRICGAEVVDLVAFGDHQRFGEDDAEALLVRAARERAALVTTTKDRARLFGETAPALVRLREASRVVAVDLVFDDPSAVLARLEVAMARRRTAVTADRR